MPTIPLRGMKMVGDLYGLGNSDIFIANQLKNGSGLTFPGGALLKLVAGALSPLAAGQTIGAGDDNLSDTNLITAGGLAWLSVESAIAGVTRFLYAEQLMPGAILEGNLVTGADGDTTGPNPDGSRIPNGTMDLVLATTHLYTTVGILWDAASKLAYFTATPTGGGHANVATVVRIGLGVAGDSMGAIGDHNARVYALIRPNIMTMGLVTS